MAIEPISQNEPIVIRDEALAAGLEWYFTGEPCKHGHVLKRRTKTRVCAGCPALRKYPPIPLTHEYLVKTLSYDEQTGEFRRLRSRHKSRIGVVVGHRSKEGYVRIPLLGKNYMAHILAVFYVTGKWPDGQLDHRSRKRDENVFANLRNATASLNAANRKRPSNNTSGFKGVSWHKLVKKWRAYITYNKKRYSLGYYDDPKEAYAAHVEASKRFFGEFSPYNTCE